MSSMGESMADLASGPYELEVKGCPEELSYLCLVLSEEAHVEDIEDVREAVHVQARLDSQEGRQIFLNFVELEPPEHPENVGGE